MTIWLLTLLACGDKDDPTDTSEADTDTDTDTDTDSDSDTDTDSDTDADPEPCGTLSVEACETRKDCWTLAAWPVQDDGSGGYCIDYEVREDVGCEQKDIGCGDAPTWAAPPEDPSDCYMFGSTCQPDGWVACKDPAVKWAKEECPE